MNNIDRAERFILLAEKFIHIFKTQETVLNFDTMRITRHACGTAACHGGWGLVALAPEKVTDESSFITGAIEIAKFLGFKDDDELTEWANDNPHLWGSDMGSEMFTCVGYEAFAGTEYMTLGDIASWYLDVAGRLLKCAG